MILACDVTRVLLVSTTTGYQIRSFGEAAARLGIGLVFVSDRCDQLEDPWWDQAIPVRFHDPMRSVESVMSASGVARPDGIVAVGDRPAVLAAHLAKAFGLKGHSVEAAARSRNKLATRRAFKEAGFPVPWFEQVSVNGDPSDIARRVPYPAVIKPSALSGSRGVTRVDSPAEFATAFDRVRRLLQMPDVRIERDTAHDSVVVESFIPGQEYAIEAVLTEGRFRLLAIFDKPDPLDGPFFEETIYVTPSRAPVDTLRAIEHAVADAARAIGLSHGPIHAEVRISGSSGADLHGPPAVYVLEVAARPIGGLCSRALRFASGGERVSLEEILLRHAIGEDVSGYARERDASGVMMIPIPRRGVFRRVDGVDEARTVSGVEDVQITAKPETVLVPLPEGKSYLGFIFARGPEPAVVERALRDAHSRLQFVIEREVAVI